ncbi:MAG: transporter [Pseudomonadota bacterium]
MSRTWLLRSALALLPGLAGAGDAVPQWGRNLPLYPALYVQTSASFDARDQVFDAAGEEQDTAQPSLSGQTRFPEQRLDTTLAWTFPLFEAAAVPFFASRLHTARIHLGYAQTRTKGALADFARDSSDDSRTQADNLETRSSGVTDLTLEFGSWLAGSSDWRMRKDTPYALLLLNGVTLPTGIYGRDTPANPGSNTVAAYSQLGFYARPWAGAHLDAGLGYRVYLKNQDPAFGLLAPANQGNDFYWDVSLAQRLLPSLYIAAFADGRKGDKNAYENPRFAPNAPPPPSTTPPSDNYPRPGVYYDGGTELIRAGASLYGFIGQHWRLGLHYALPLSGESGEFDLPYNNRQPAGCTVGSTGCTVSDGGTVQNVDGQGPARVFASPQFTLSLQFNFGQGDSYTCVGCKQP